MLGEEPFLYQTIADSIRKEILDGRWKPGEKLPTVRDLCTQWDCTPGTVQRAYKLLVTAGLITSQAGKGTRVAGIVPKTAGRRQEMLRKANLVNRTEEFLLESLSAGYEMTEIKSAIEIAMDRWHALERTPAQGAQQVIRFVGSHDMAVNGLAQAFFGEVFKDATMQISISGSMGGLVAISEGKADFCGCHLWDGETATYNIPFVERLFPDHSVMVVTLAERNLGLITAPGNPFRIHSIQDLARADIRFINRQAGSGTRVWLDAELQKFGISARQIRGYKDERITHYDIARAVAENSADTGLGLESAAASYGLDFIMLTRERYDLVMKKETAQQPAMKALLNWMQKQEGKDYINQFTGYDSTLTGKIQLR